MKEYSRAGERERERELESERALERGEFEREIGKLRAFEYGERGRPNRSSTFFSSRKQENILLALSSPKVQLAYTLSFTKIIKQR